MWTEDIGKTESKLICNSSPYSLLENVKQNNSGKFNILIKELN
jgi:hypothetical protein